MEKTQSSATTFVHVGTQTFRDVVQRLTGPSNSSSSSINNNTEKQNANCIKRQTTTSKLHERRQNEYYSKPKLEIVKPPLNFHLQSMADRRRRKQSWGSSSSFTLSPSSSPVGTPTATFSKLSILEKNNNKTEQEQDNKEKEERALTEKGFYLHPSPRCESEHDFTEPELLALFPVTSSTMTDEPQA